MHADSADRIFAAPPPEALQPWVSIPRIFALGLVLPFAQLHRLILAGVIPAILVGGFFLSPPGRAALEWASLFAAFYFQVRELGGAPPPQPPILSPAAFGWACLALFLATTIWLCAWQRGAARGFAEPVGRWLGRSLLRFPGYALAILLWLVAPIVITLPGSLVIAWALRQSLQNAEYGLPNGLGLHAAMLTPVQWWVAGIGTLTFTLFGIWMSARLLPLPALVASQGWRRSFGRAWRASSGHGFGLSVSLIGYSLIGGVLAFVISTLVLMALIYQQTEFNNMTVMLRSMQITSISSLAMTMLILFWNTGIASLLVRESASLDDPLDLATFD